MAASYTQISWPRLLTKVLHWFTTWDFRSTEMANEKAEVYMHHEHPQPHPNDQPADVFQTMQESEAWVVRGLLVDSGLEAELFSLEASADVLPGVGWFVVRVPQEDAEEARQLIAEQHVPGDDTDETAA